MSNQVASAAAAAAAACSKAEDLLNQSRVITPHHRLLQHDVLLLSVPASVEPNCGSELLGEGALEEGVRLVRDSLSLFPLQVTLRVVHFADVIVVLIPCGPRVTR